MRRDRGSTPARRGDSWLFTGMGWLIYKKGVYISIYELWMYVIYEKHVCNIYICIYIYIILYENSMSIHVGCFTVCVSFLAMQVVCTA